MEGSPNRTDFFFSVWVWDLGHWKKKCFNFLSFCQTIHLFIHPPIHPSSTPNYSCAQGHSFWETHFPFQQSQLTSQNWKCKSYSCCNVLEPQVPLWLLRWKCFLLGSCGGGGIRPPLVVPNRREAGAVRNIWATRIPQLVLWRISAAVSSAGKCSSSRLESDTNSRRQPAAEEGWQRQTWDNPPRSGYKAGHCCSRPDWLRASSVWFIA